MYISINSTYASTHSSNVVTQLSNMQIYRKKNAALQSNTEANSHDISRCQTVHDRNINAEKERTCGGTGLLALGGIFAQLFREVFVVLIALFLVFQRHLVPGQGITKTQIALRRVCEPLSSIIQHNDCCFSVIPKLPTL